MIRLPKRRDEGLRDPAPGWTSVGVHGDRRARLAVHALLAWSSVEPTAADVPGRRDRGSGDPSDLARSPLLWRILAAAGPFTDRWPDDVAALMGTLDIDRFGVAGHSSGGPYAVAVAALLPDRVSGLVTFGGVTDMGWPGAAEGYFESELELMRMPDEESVVRWCEQHFGKDGSGFMAASGMGLPEADLPLYADDRIASLLSVARAEAFRQGVGGYAQDVSIQGRPWSFAPSQIRARGIILHGEGDTLLPLAHSLHTADLVPGARLEVLPGHGHFSLLGELPGIATGLLA
jgi:pimeloyl-ACP methyl ester carboxylesterase